MISFIVFLLTERYVVTMSYYCYYVTVNMYHMGIVVLSKIVSFCSKGNELSGNGVGTRVAAEQYASDVSSLQSIVEDIYMSSGYKPLIVAPGGFFDANWFKIFIDKSTKTLNVVTHHIYNLGPGIFIKNLLFPFSQTKELKTKLFKYLIHRS